MELASQEKRNGIVSIVQGCISSRLLCASMELCDICLASFLELLNKGQ